MVRRKTGPGRDTRKKTKPRPRRASKPIASRGRNPIQRLITIIQRNESAISRQRAPAAARIGAILAEFRAKLAEALDEKPNKPAPKRSANQSVAAESVAAPSAAEADVNERVRVYTLDRVSGTIAKQIVIREPIDESVDPEDIAFRVGCLELADDEPWTWVDGSVEGDAIRIYFPDDRYYGFPPFLDLERPRKPQIGQTWRLRRTDGVTAASYVLRSVEITERPRARWKHGDVVRALFEGKPLVARFIRTSEIGEAIVHWNVDGMFSAIPMEDVLAVSTKRWTQELEPEDVEIEF